MKKNTSFRESFRCALLGLADAWKNERNMKIHLTATAVALIIAVKLRIERWEWLFFSSAVFLVFTMEMLNTALERVVDLFTSEFHPLARLAKNAAAGAALLSALYALVVAALIFAPRLFNFF